MQLHISGSSLERSRVWLSELPAATYSSSQVLVQEIPAKAGNFKAVRRAAREWRGAQLGHPSTYGLLGAEFIPDNGDTLRIEMPVITKEEQSSWESTLVDSDVVSGFSGWFFRIGLVSRYEAEGALEAAAAVAEAVGLGAGRLLLCCAVTSPMTSRMVFRWLAESVVRLIALPERIAETQVIDVVKHPIYW